MRTRLSTIACIVVAFATLTAQSGPPPRDPQQPVFRTESNFIRVDMYPTRDGVFVGDLRPEEVEVLELAQRRVTLRRLAWVTGGVDSERLRAVYALLASGVLTTDTAPGAEAATPIIQLETGTFLLSALRHKPDPSAREALLRAVRHHRS